MNTEDIKKIKDVTKEFLQKMTIIDFDVKLKAVFYNNQEEEPKKDLPLRDIVSPPALDEKNAIELNIELKEPQILIGSNGQTLFELQKVLRIILNKRLSMIFYLKLDINDYKKKKIEYLKNLAQNIANEVSITKEKKVLLPMPAYQRRIIHIELAKRQDIITESEGDRENRCIIIKPVV